MANGKSFPISQIYRISMEAGDSNNGQVILRSLTVLLVIQYASAMGFGGGLGGGFGGGYGMGAPRPFAMGYQANGGGAASLGVSKVTAVGVSEEATVTGMPRDCTGWSSTLPGRADSRPQSRPTNLVRMARRILLMSP
ncbi:hypothetical protein CEXT_35261 [Caerostris extrusa]|uniref:Uncharacterized protein n=1 Tax=Caerostris extrusa TaxID=172846 RepID=A0AAV4NPQ2_CAEEX|nr:hypothetical protein CEXT_35261 [Caerostris extrusa]